MGSKGKLDVVKKITGLLGVMDNSVYYASNQFSMLALAVKSIRAMINMLCSSLYAMKGRSDGIYRNLKFDDIHAVDACLDTLHKMKKIDYENLVVNTIKIILKYVAGMDIDYDVKINNPVLPFLRAVKRGDAIDIIDSIDGYDIRYELYTRWSCALNPKGDDDVYYVASKLAFSYNIDVIYCDGVRIFPYSSGTRKHIHTIDISMYDPHSPKYSNLQLIPCSPSNIDLYGFLDVKVDDLDERSKRFIDAMDNYFKLHRVDLDDFREENYKPDSDRICPIRTILNIANVIKEPDLYDNPVDFLCENIKCLGVICDSIDRLLIPL